MWVCACVFDQYPCVYGFDCLRHWLGLTLDENGGVGLKKKERKKVKRKKEKTRKKKREEKKKNPLVLKWV